MAIKFSCECGKALATKDGTEGRKAKCPACGLVVTIPAPLRLEGGDDLEVTPGRQLAGTAEACPNCGSPMPFEAVLCVQCGFDRRTGAAVGQEPEAGGWKRRPRGSSIRVALPYGKLGVCAAIAAALAAGWFFVAAPILGRMRTSYGVGYVTSGDLAKAVAHFEKVRPNVGPAEQERIDLWFKQLQLEREKNAGDTLDQGIEIKSDTIDMALKQKSQTGGALIFAVKIANRGRSELTLKNDYFYVRGIQDIVLVATHEENSLDGVVVPVNEMREGNLAFRAMPKNPVRRGKAGGALAGTGYIYYYIIFNDGVNYVKRVLLF